MRGPRLVCRQTCSGFAAQPRPHWHDMGQVAFIDLCSGSGSVALAASRLCFRKVYVVDRDHSRLTDAAAEAATAIKADIETAVGHKKVLDKFHCLKKEGYVVVVHASPDCTNWSKAKCIHGPPDTAAAVKHTDAVLSLLDHCDAWTVENPTAEGHSGALWAHDKYKDAFPFQVQVNYCCYGALYKKGTTIACSDPYTFLLLAPWAKTCTECACPSTRFKPGTRNLNHASDICATKKDERMVIPAQLALRLVECLHSRALQLHKQRRFEAADSQPCPGKVVGFSCEMPDGWSQPAVAAAAAAAAARRPTRQQAAGALQVHPDKPWFLWLPAGAEQQQPQQQEQGQLGASNKRRRLPLQPGAQWVQKLPGGIHPADAVWQDSAKYIEYYNSHKTSEVEVFRVDKYEVDAQGEVCFWVQRPHMQRQQMLTGFDNREPEEWYWANPSRFADYMEQMRVHRAAAAAAAADRQAAAVREALQRHLQQGSIRKTGASEGALARAGHNAQGPAAIDE